MAKENANYPGIYSAVLSIEDRNVYEKESPEKNPFHERKDPRHDHGR